MLQLLRGAQSVGLVWSLIWKKTVLKHRQDRQAALSTNQSLIQGSLGSSHSVQGCKPCAEFILAIGFSSISACTVRLQPRLTTDPTPHVGSIGLCLTCRATMSADTGLESHHLVEDGSKRGSAATNTSFPSVCGNKLALSDVRSRVSEDISW